MKLVKYDIDCGRMGAVSGIMVYDDEEWSKLQTIINKKVDVYFGEVLGKHSEVSVRFDEDDFQIVSEDETVCSTLKREVGTLVSGYNPLDFVDEEILLEYKEED